ncbi:MAG TPA: hypothetical protein VGK87_16280 [Anaerolineae bacterium]
MRSKLTPDDIQWLEHRLSRALEPVEPRPAFVHDAKEALFNGDYDEVFDPRTAVLPLLALAMLSMGVTLFATYVMRHRGVR